MNNINKDFFINDADAEELILEEKKSCVRVTDRNLEKYLGKEKFDYTKKDKTNILKENEII